MTRVGVTGHQKAPLSVWKYLDQTLPGLLRDASDLVGVTSLAAGADQEFADLVIRLGGDLLVVVPSDNYVASFERSTDRTRFEVLLNQALLTERLDYDEPTEDAFLAAGRRVVDLCDLLVAVWDGLPAQGKGGTADVVAYARQQGKPVEVIWPTGVKR